MHFFASHVIHAKVLFDFDKSQGHQALLKNKEHNA